MSMGKEKQTQAVYDHHLRAFKAKDLDALMEDYTEQSVVIVNLAPGAAIGLTAIREFFTHAFEKFSAEMMTNMKDVRLEIAGEVAYAVWTALPGVPFGSDTFVIRDGKIAIQTATVPGA